MSSRRTALTLAALAGSVLAAHAIGRRLAEVAVRTPAPIADGPVAPEVMTERELARYLAEPDRVRHARFVRDTMDLHAGRRDEDASILIAPEQVAIVEAIAAESAPNN